MTAILFMVATVRQSVDAPPFDAESWPYVVIRWVSYAAMVLLIGTVAFKAAVIRRLPLDSNGGSDAVAIDAERSAAAVGAWAASALLMASIARLLAQSRAVFGADAMVDAESIRPLLFETTWGQAWIAQLVIGALLLATFVVLGRKASTRRPIGWRPMWWRAAAAMAIALAFTPAFAGHAASVPRGTAWAILSDGLHVVSASAWLGALCVLLLAGIPATGVLEEGARLRSVSQMVMAFTPLALSSAAVVCLTGGYAAWLHVGHLSALWQTDYGRVLVTKLAMLSLVLAIGAYNFRTVGPVVGRRFGVDRLRRSAAAELVCALLVLLITAVLVATPTARDEELSPSVRAGGRARRPSVLAFALHALHSSTTRGSPTCA